MRRWKIGSFTAAIGCIAAGVIITLAQFDILTYAALGYLWPALLILFGLEMLGRLMIQSDAKSRTSGWAIVLIILLVAASAGQNLFSGGSISNWFGNSQLTSLSGTVEVKSEIKTVKIVIPSGKVNVDGVDGSSLEYEGSLLVAGSTPSEAENEIKERWKVNTDGETLILEMAEETNWFSSLQIGLITKSPYLNVSVPQNLAVEIDTSNGNIEAKGIQSGLDVNTSNGALNVHDISGGVQAHSSNGSLTVKNIKGDVDLVSSNGSIILEQIDGSLSAKSSNGEIIVNSPVAGDWKCTSSNGKIIVTTTSAPDAKITADTSNGSLKGNVPWKFDNDDEDRGSVLLGSGTYEVDLSTSNGGIMVDTAE